jgi:hypothetical protein
MSHNTEVAKVAKLVPYGYIKHEEHASNILPFSVVFRSQIIWTKNNKAESADHEGNVMNPVKDIL